jgi:hypothetical protein
MGESHRERENIKKKRVRDDDSVVNQHEMKLARVDSENSVVNSPETKLVVQDDILDILDDADTDPSIQGLDSVIKSFEEEILVLPTSAIGSGESRNELGYLLEASDDELGLPPSFSSGDDAKNTSPFVDLTTGDGSGSFVGLEGVMLEYEDEIPSYDSFEIVGDSARKSNNDVLTLGDELFDYSGDTFDPAGYSDSSWRQESSSSSFW